jgi:hypothetical protein
LSPASFSTHARPVGELCVPRPAVAVSTVPTGQRGVQVNSSRGIPAVIGRMSVRDEHVTNQTQLSPQDSWGAWRSVHKACSFKLIVEWVNSMTKQSIEMLRQGLNDLNYLHPSHTTAHLSLQAGRGSCKRTGRYRQDDADQVRRDQAILCPVLSKTVDETTATFRVYIMAGRLKARKMGASGMSLRTLSRHISTLHTRSIEQVRSWTKC